MYVYVCCTVYIIHLTTLSIICLLTCFVCPFLQNEEEVKKVADEEEYKGNNAV